MRNPFVVGDRVCEKPGTNSYWVDGLTLGEVLGTDGSSTHVRIIKTIGTRWEVGVTLWMETDCLVPFYYPLDCQFNTFVFD